jgi:multiple sugar transport system ATP-binding protein
VRPENVGVETEPGEGTWPGKVGVAEHLGADTFIHVHAGDLGTINVRASGEMPVRHGDTVYLRPDPAKVYRFDAQGMAI